MKEKIGIFGAGCFWGVEEAFSKIDGVLGTEVGYMGGNEGEFPDPTYEQVCSDKTGYVEVVRVRYDEDKISFKKLLDFFWRIHNPALINRQGFDFGSQYRSILFYLNVSQKKELEESMNREEKKHRKKITTEVLDGKKYKFFRAEEYHQKYNEKNKEASC